MCEIAKISNGSAIAKISNVWDCEDLQLVEINPEMPEPPGNLHSDTLHQTRSIIVFLFSWEQSLVFQWKRTIFEGFDS